jgi:3-hydroxybutyrate dehydrogenase
VSAKHVLVTGGGRGIGAAVVERMVLDGYRVSFVGRSRSALDETQARVRELGGDVEATVCDVTSEAEVIEVFGELARRRGAVDVLVNNAGVASSAPFAGTTLEAFESQFRVNTTGVFLSTRAVLPAMLEAGWGRVITVA